MSSTPPDTEGFGPRAKTHEEFAKSTVDDPELSSNNFGAGVYKNAEVYEQTQRFKDSINAMAGVGQDIAQLALGETYLALARSGWEVEYRDDPFEVPIYEDAFGSEYENAAKRAKKTGNDRHERELLYGRYVFEELPDHVQDFAIDELSTLEGQFDPPEMRVTKFFHEATRSKGGRLMDNVFGRVRKMIQEGIDNTSNGGGLFSRGGNS